MSGKKAKMPLGIKLIVVFYVLAIAGYCLSLLFASLGLRGENLGPGEIIIGLISFSLWILAVVSILKRFQWGWYFNLGLMTYTLLQTIYQIFKPSTSLSNSTETIMCWSVPVILLALFYLYKRKSYFAEHKASTI